jgi:heat shock protein HslJ
MKKSLTIVAVAMLVAACGEHADPRAAQEKLRHTPGYREARNICAQCHALPLPDQHPAVAWPSVVARMEGYIRSANKRMPTPEEEQALLGYFQANSNWK